MTIGCLFDFILELLEVREHLALLAHRINPCVPGEVDDERYIVTTTTECCHLGWSPHIPLLGEQLSMLYSELAGLTYACNLFLSECRESDEDSFKLHSFELLENNVSYPLVT